VDAREGGGGVSRLGYRLRPGRAGRPGHHGDAERGVPDARLDAVAEPSTRAASGAARLTAAAEPRPIPQPTGPSGVHPKNWLTTGGWMTNASAAAAPTLAAPTARLRLPA